MRAPTLIYGLITLALSICATAVSVPVGNLIERDTSNSTQPPAEEAHNFKFREFRPQPGPNGSFRQPYFRFLVLFRQKPGTMEEYFHSHWKTVHADLTLADPDVGLRLQRYTQLHQDKEHRDKIKPLIAGTNGAMQMAPYDGIAEFHARDYETFEKFMLQAFHDPAQTGDQAKFADTTGPFHVMAGYDNLILGSGMDSANGYDGILPSDSRFIISD